MAGLVVVAGMVLIDKHRARKEARAQKLIYDDERYAELQRETSERLAQVPMPGSSANHRRVLSETSTIDTTFNDKHTMVAEDDARRWKKSKWWKLKPLKRRTRSTV